MLWVLNDQRYVAAIRRGVHPHACSIPCNMPAHLVATCTIQQHTAEANTSDMHRRSSVLVKASLGWWVHTSIF